MNFWKRQKIDEEGVPGEILIFPPENNELTDEDSGEEDDVLLQNLPRSQLIAHAEVRLPETVEPTILIVKMDFLCRIFSKDKK